MQTVRWIVAAAVFIALLFLSLQNSDPVTLRLFNLANWQAPLIFVVFVAFATGVAAGLLAGALRASRLKRQLSRLRRDLRRGNALGDGKSGDASHGTKPPSAPGLAHHDRIPDGL
jgi:uncharacterized integral membrane protein